MAGILQIPQEILDQIVEKITENPDLNSLCRSSNGLRWALSDRLFTVAFDRISQKEGIKQAVSTVFMHAVKHDSQFLIQWLLFRECGAYLKGYMPMMKGIKYLHYSILQDAPRVTNHLVKHGAFIDDDEFDYPDLQLLYWAIALPTNQPRDNLDGALRVASSYALPRAAEFLLIRGADPNTHGSFGFAAIHIVVRRRPAWRRFKAVSKLSGIEDSESNLWNTKVIQTTEILIRFGAQLSLGVLTTRLHVCGHKCWRSLDCAHCGQLALHIAAAGGNEKLVSFLLTMGARPSHRDREGNTPAFAAMVQGNEAIVRLLLKPSYKASRKKLQNYIISNRTKSTALHIACRFALTNIVLELLKCGARVDVTDSKGQTPLHEVLGQCAPEREDKVVETLHILASKAASPDVANLQGITARSLAGRHAFPKVREMFESATENQLLYESAFDETIIEEDYETRPTWGEHMIDGLFTKLRPRRASQGGWVNKHEPVYLWPSSPNDPPVYANLEPELPAWCEGDAKAPIWVKDTFPSLPAVQNSSSSHIEAPLKTSQTDTPASEQGEPKRNRGRKHKRIPIKL